MGEHDFKVSRVKQVIITLLLSLFHNVIPEQFSSHGSANLQLLTSCVKPPQQTMRACFKMHALAF